MKRTYFWLLLPAISVLFITVVLPLVQIILQSFTDASLLEGSAKLIGTKNYAKVIQDYRFWDSVWVTLVLAGGSLAIQMTVGLGIALVLQQQFWFTKLGRVLFIAPMIVPPVVAGIVWLMLFSSVLPGVNYFLGLVGIEGPAWFDHYGSARFAVIVAHGWYSTPFVMLLLLAGLESLPSDPVEAAHIDGASRWQIFQFITLPLIKPLLIFVFIYQTVTALKLFGLIYVMTGGGPGRATEAMNFHVWRTAFYSYKVGLASAIAVIMMVIIFSIVYLMGWYGRKTGAIK